MGDLEAVVRPYCDWYSAFVALPEELERRPPKDWAVTDLTAELPDLVLPDDWAKAPNNVQKFHAAVVYLANEMRHSLSEWQPQWYCFLETDVYFIPENFRRLVALRGWDKRPVPTWVGTPRLHALARDGYLLDPFMAG
eukprot:1479747-Amphidinium_carterae.1